MINKYYEGTSTIINLSTEIGKLLGIIFVEYYEEQEFARKDYLKMFSTISGATASRDLKYGLSQRLFEKYGVLRNTRYKILEK